MHEPDTTMLTSDESTDEIVDGTTEDESDRAAIDALTVPADGAGDPTEAPTPGTAAHDEHPPDDGATASDEAEARPRVGDPVVFSFCTEKVEGEGEDAPPVVVQCDGCTYLAVFDGLGGAGAERLADPDDPGRRITSAYLGSRAARDVLQATLDDSAPPGGHLDQIRPELERRLDAALSELQTTHVSTSRVKSKLKRPFPTTLALASVTPVTDATRVELLWAGDSRVLALLPDTGLVQLTRDHVQVNDGSTDAPMTRAVAVGTTSLEHHAVELPADAIVFAATDGCFGYWPTPGHFEFVLLDSMANAVDLPSWGDGLRRRISGATGDDASIALAAPGDPDIPALCERFAGRRSFIHKLVACFDRPTDSERAWLWRMYRSDYEQFLPPPVDGGPDVAEVTGLPGEPAEDARLDESVTAATDSTDATDSIEGADSTEGADGPVAQEVEPPNDEAGDHEAGHTDDRGGC